PDLERELARDDPLADGLGALDDDLRDAPARPGVHDDRDAALVPERVDLALGGHLGEGVALVADPPERLVLELEEAEVGEADAALERRALAEAAPVLAERGRELLDGRAAVGAAESELLEPERRALVDRVEDADVV